MVGNRLSKITTRTGDNGTTGLAKGQRLSKSASRIEALGAVDELNSFIGLLAAEPLPPEIAATLEELQHGLFDLGAELAVPGSSVVAEGHVAGIEAATERFNAALPPLPEFILPGGDRAAAICHVARAVCRRAERSLVALGEAEPDGAKGAIFLNRASDLLFVLARVIARQSGRVETPWRGPGPSTT